MTDEPIEFASIEEALDAIALGLMVVVMDDESRENEGDLIMSARHASSDKVTLMSVTAAAAFMTDSIVSETCRWHSCCGTQLESSALQCRDTMLKDSGCRLWS